MTIRLCACVAMLSTWCGIASAQSSLSPERAAERAAAQRAAAQIAANAAQVAAQEALANAAVVENSRIRLVIPRPLPSRRRPSEPSVGHYAWQISVPEPAAFTLVLLADSAMRSTSLSDILRASTLRLCPTVMPGSLLECVTPIRAKVETYRDGIRVTIEDKDFVARVRRERPVFCALSAIEPGGRIQMMEHSWVYKDRGPK